MLDLFESKWGFLNVQSFQTIYKLIRTHKSCKNGSLSTLRSPHFQVCIQGPRGGILNSKLAHFFWTFYAFPLTTMSKSQENHWSHQISYFHSYWATGLESSQTRTPLSCSLLVLPGAPSPDISLFLAVVVLVAFAYYFSFGISQYTEKGPDHSQYALWSQQERSIITSSYQMERHMCIQIINALVALCKLTERVNKEGKEVLPPSQLV